MTPRACVGWLMLVLLGYLAGAAAIQAQTVPTYTPRLLVEQDRAGLEVTWARDTGAIRYGHVLVCFSGSPRVGGGCAPRPTFRDSTFPLAGVDTVWRSLAGLAGDTLTMATAIEVLYQTGVTRKTYPFPGQPQTLIVPNTAPPAPPPTYPRYQDTADLLIGTGQVCPIVILYDEDPATPLYSITTPDPSCAAYAAAMNREWNP